MSEVDRAVARAGELLNRVADERRVGARQRARVGEAGSRLTRVVIADGVIVAAAVAIGLFVPLGILGFSAVLVMLLLATLFFAAMPVGPEPTPERLRETPLKALPAQTARWLDTQRPALPAPARPLLDGIGIKLDTLAPQLATLGEDDPAAVEVRKLVGEQLPEFLKGYARVPEPLRKVPRNGKSPDTELADGLRVIDEEIAEMTVKLAQGDLDGLATRGRFLEIKYRDDGVAS